MRVWTLPAARVQRTRCRRERAPDLFLNLVRDNDRHRDNIAANLDLNRLWAEDSLACNDVALIILIECPSPVAAACRRILCRVCRDAARSSLAWLRLPAGLSSAAEPSRAGFWREGSSRERARFYADVLVHGRLALFRSSWILSRALQRRQFWPVLDMDADWSRMELRVTHRQQQRLRPANEIAIGNSD